MPRMPRIKKKWQRERLKLVASRAAHQRDNLWHQEQIKKLAELVSRSNEVAQKLEQEADRAQANNRLLMKELGALQDELHERDDEYAKLLLEVRKLRHFRDQINGFPKEEK